MISFASDYIKGAHPKVLEALLKTNMEVTTGYGTDQFTASAREKIKAACGCPDGDVWFLSGGTQTNALVISALLKCYEGVLSADTGHINAHEAGAVEHTGHKVLPLPHYDGKIRAEDVEHYITAYYEDENFEHMVYPGMVYISHPTEYGTLYSKEELTALSHVCREKKIPLYMDGARLGYGLMSYETDVTLKDIASLCDAFYIGGTKVGTLCGEALVFPKGAPEHFLSIIKNHSALIAKGRLTGVQFDALFTDNLYFEIGKHAIEMAEKLKEIFRKKGYEFFLNSPTNQQFIVLENEKMEELSKKVTFSFWEKYDETHTVVRFATSWSTTDDEIRYLEECL